MSTETFDSSVSDTRQPAEIDGQAIFTALQWGLFGVLLAAVAWALYQQSWVLAGLAAIVFMLQRLNMLVQTVITLWLEHDE